MRTAQLFITCLLDTLYPETCEAVVRVLERAGVEVNLPGGQARCGQLAHQTAGDETSALTEEIVR